MLRCNRFFTSKRIIITQEGNWAIVVNLIRDFWLRFGQIKVTTKQCWQFYSVCYLCYLYDII